MREGLSRAESRAFVASMDAFVFSGRARQLVPLRLRTFSQPCCRIACLRMDASMPDFL